MPETETETESETEPETETARRQRWRAVLLQSRGSTHPRQPGLNSRGPGQRRLAGSHLRIGSDPEWVDGSTGT